MVKFIDRTGAEAVSRSGLKMRVLKYHSARSVDILFEETGQVVNKPFASFLSGKVAAPMLVVDCGQYCEVSNPNTGGDVFLLDKDDLLILAGKMWHKNSSGYIVRGTGAKERLHRLIVSVPFNAQVDHINGNTLDNRKSNLRLCTCAENNRNRKSRGGGFKGVTRNAKSKKNPFIAQIVVNKKHLYLGSFKSEVAAARAYNEAAKKYFGEFAKLNEVL